MYFEVFLFFIFFLLFPFVLLEIETSLDFRFGINNSLLILRVSTVFMGLVIFLESQKDL